MSLDELRIDDCVSLKDGSKQIIIVGLMDGQVSGEDEDVVYGVTVTGSYITFHPSTIEDFCF